MPIDIITVLVGGIILKITGLLSKSRYFHTYFFINDTSNLTFIYYTKSTNISEASKLSKPMNMKYVSMEKK